MRNARLEDFDFIYNLVLAEARDGHFNRQLLEPAATQGWRLNLTSILTLKKRHDGITAYGLIWEINGNRAGFVLMSGGPGNKGNELWMAAIAPQFRRSGEGRKMVADILRQFKGKRLILAARCSVESEAMFHILTTNGFEQVSTGEEGTRTLLYTE